MPSGLSTPTGAVATLVDSGKITLGIADSGVIELGIADSGRILLTASIDDSDSLNYQLTYVILDENYDPILDVQGQYILGGQA